MSSTKVQKIMTQPINLIFRFLQNVRLPSRSLRISLSVPILRSLTATAPLFFIIIVFRDLQKTRIQVWLYENTDLRVEGRIIGFDEYMNLVLDDAEELSVKKMTRKALGRILLKGDNITLLMST